MLDVVKHGLAALDFEAIVMGLYQRLDRVSQLTAAPVFQAMNLSTIAGNDSLIAFDHGGHLLALIGMQDKHYFVVTHKQLLVDIFRSEENTSELQSLMRISYAVFCLKNKKQ